MRIATNTMSSAITTQIDNLSAQQAVLQNEVSTGQDVTEPGDNPAAVNTALMLESQLRQTDQYASNSAQALSVAQAASTGLTTLQDVANRAGELATLGTGTTGTDSMSSYATEANQLIEEAVTAANTEYNGQYLYGGTATSSPPFAVTRDASGDITSVSYNGNSSSAPIQIAAGTSVAATTDGTTNQGFASLINDLVSLRDALNSGDTTAVAATETNLTNDGDNITAAIATNGGIQSRIEAAQNQQTTDTTNLNTQLSSTVDADLATTVTKLDQTQTAYSAALESAVSSMQISILNYIH
jgi:flagellar hook-associated protein 3 FlgL